MFDDYIAFHARARPHAPAVVTPGGRIDFARLDAAVDRAACAVVRLPAVPGEPVAVRVGDPYLEWVLVLALARRGIASAPRRDRACRLAVADDAPDAALYLTPDAAAAILDGPARKIVPHRPDAAALGRVLRSSGTTGAEKRIGLSWQVIDAGIRNAPIAYGAPGGVWLPGTGIATILGFVVTLAAWASGNAAAIGFGEAIDGDVLDEVAPSFVAIVPDQLRRLLTTLPEGRRPEPMRVVVGGGAVPPALAGTARRRLGDDIRAVYGASETGAVAVAGLDLLERSAGAAGHVLPGVRVEIVDGDGAACPPGALGRIRIAGARVVAGCLDGPPASPDGWFYPGDLGRLEADGLLLVEGRVDDLMNLGGHKVLPGWVEEAALACPGVADAAAFGLADADGLERCWLALVVSDGFDEALLMTAMERPLGLLKTVRWIGVDRVPRNAMGKVERLRLRALVAERLASEG